MSTFRLPRRRHELALVLLLVAAAGLIGFWLGRVTAPDPEIAYLRGKADGQHAERLKLDQDQIELGILKGELDATRSASKEDEPERAKTAAKPKRQQAPSETPEEPTQTAVGATN